MLNGLEIEVRGHWTKGQRTVGYRNYVIRMNYRLLTVSPDEKMDENLHFVCLRVKTCLPRYSRQLSNLINSTVQKASGRHVKLWGIERYGLQFLPRRTGSLKWT